MSIELYGLLILTVLGFILPILTILLTLFPDGAKSLRTRYENEKKLNEDNLVNEVQKQGSDAKLDYKAIEKTIKELKKNKKRAENKLSYLVPTKLFVLNAVPFVASLLAVIVSFEVRSSLSEIPLIASIVFFACGAFVLWTSISILGEVAETVNQSKRTTEEKIIDLLTRLVEKSGVDNLYLKEGQVVFSFNSRILKDETSFEFSVNKEYKLPVSITNKSDKMAKNIEVGLILPKKMLVDQTPNLKLFVDEETQIVRFNREILQAHENNLCGDMSITFLEAGEYGVAIFIKGENVKYHRFHIKLKIIH
jgi:hypothetical protein